MQQTPVSGTPACSTPRPEEIHIGFAVQSVDEDHHKSHATYWKESATIPASVDLNTGDITISSNKSCFNLYFTLYQGMGTDFHVNGNRMIEANANFGAPTPDSVSGYRSFYVNYQGMPQGSYDKFTVYIFKKDATYTDTAYALEDPHVHNTGPPPPPPPPPGYGGLLWLILCLVLLSIGVTTVLLRNRAAVARLRERLEDWWRRRWP
jgi:hypothetical protein